MKTKTIVKFSMSLVILMALPSQARDCTKLLEAHISANKLVNMPEGNREASRIQVALLCDCLFSWHSYQSHFSHQVT